jgi:hypothetical protein
MQYGSHKLGKASALSHMICYARVSTEEQNTDPKLDESHSAGCHAYWRTMPLT